MIFHEGRIPWLHYETNTQTSKPVIMTHSIFPLSILYDHFYGIRAEMLRQTLSCAHAKS